MTFRRANLQRRVQRNYKRQKILRCKMDRGRILILGETKENSFELRLSLIHI